ncbi:MAG: sensor histidine kinase [Woeseiaceae bacterium]|nr:sensor histidine kinase [Woeseiaceae bacterium]
MKFRPAFLPFLRFAWAIAAAVAASIGVLLYAGVDVPIPFTTMLVLIVVTSLMGGRLSGVLSGLSLVSLGVFVYVLRLGDPPLLQVLEELLMGSIVAVGLGLFLGSIRQTLEDALVEIERQSREIAAQNKDLIRRVDENSAALNATRQRLYESQERLRNATRRLIDAQETERRGLARELHDDIGQSLTALRINLESNKRNFAQDATSLKVIETSYRLVDEIIASVRELSLTLRPSLLDDLGLIAALREYVGKQLERADVSLDLDVEGSDAAIDSTHSIAAYRIVQEIISNITKHASASHVDMSLFVNTQFFRIGIRDDGVGFDVDLDKSEQVGLASMRERATLLGGKVEIDSTPGEGTMVTVQIPLSFNVDEDAAA